MSTALQILLSFIFLFATSAHALIPFEPRHTLVHSTESVPYWGEENLAKRMRKETAIIDSVETSKLPSGRIHLRIRAAAWVKRSLEETFAIATDFAHIKQWSSYFSEAKFDPSREQVAVHMRVLEHSAQMLIQFEPDTTTANKKVLMWQVLKGTFHGLKGEIRFSPEDVTHTRVSAVGSYDVDSLPLPRTLSALVLEVVIQHIGTNIRNYVEHAPTPTKTKGVEM